MDGKIFSEEEIKKLMKPYSERFNLQMFCKQGTPVKGNDTTMYDCCFMDDLNVSVIISPDGNFRFERIVDLFKLSSQKMSPVDYPDHFERMYLRFRKTVERFGCD